MQDWINTVSSMGWEEATVLIVFIGAVSTVVLITVWASVVKKRKNPRIGIFGRLTKGSELPNVVKARSKNKCGCECHESDDKK